MPSCTRASLMCGEDSGGRNSFRRNFFDLSGFSPRASGPAPVRVPASGPAPGPGPNFRLCPSPAPVSGSAFCPADQVFRKRFPTAASRVARGPFLPGQLRLPGVVSPACFTWAAAPAWCSLSGLFHLGIQSYPDLFSSPNSPLSIRWACFRLALRREKRQHSQIVYPFVMNWI